MRALVTGATGFVGGHLVEALLRRGVEVTVLLRSPGKGGAAAPAGVRAVQATSTTPARSLRPSRGPESHLSRRRSGRGTGRRGVPPGQSRRHGQSHRRQSADVAAGHAPGSSSSPRWRLAGPAQRGVPLAGDEPPAPVTAYGRSKLAGEEAVRAGALPWTILRPPMVYGPRDTEVLKVFKLARLGIAAGLRRRTQELSAVTP